MLSGRFPQASPPTDLTYSLHFFVFQNIRNKRYAVVCENHSNSEVSETLKPVHWSPTNMPHVNVRDHTFSSF